MRTYAVRIVIYFAVCYHMKVCPVLVLLLTFFLCLNNDITTDKELILTLSQATSKIVQRNENPPDLTRLPSHDLDRDDTCLPEIM